MGELAALLSAMVWAATSVMLTSLTARAQPIVLSSLRLTVGTCALALTLIVSGQYASYGDATTLGLLGVMGSGFIGYALGDTLTSASLASSVSSARSPSRWRSTSA